MDIKNKKIGLILNDLNDIMLKKVKIKCKKLKELNAEVCTIVKSNEEEEIISIINQFQNLDAIVIISCTR